MRAFLALPVLLAGCTMQAPPPTSASLLASERIHFENRSWGALQEEWTIDASGAGTYTYSDRKPGESYFEYDLVTMRFDAGPEGFRELEKALAKARLAVNKQPDCAPRVTDAPYGPIEWTGASGTAELALDFGCMGEGWKPIYAAVGAGRDMVGGWGKAGTLVERRRNKS